MTKKYEQIWRVLGITFSEKLGLEQTGIEHIPKDWSVCQVKEVCTEIFSGGTPNTQIPEYWNGNINWLSSGETRKTFIRDTEKKITKMGIENSSTRLSQAGDVVVASAGQGYTRGQTAFCLVDTYINQSVVALRTKKEKMLPLFLFYNLLSRYKELRQISDAHSSRGSLTTKLLSGLTIQLPTIAEQQVIAKILSNLDFKIELNQSMNCTLDDIGAAVFKRWFVNFEFFNQEGKPYKSTVGKMVGSEIGNIPESWKVKRINEIAKITYGFTQSSSSLPVGPKFLRITDIQGGKIDWSLVPYCEISKKELSKYTLQSGDIVVARTGASTGENVYIEECPASVFASYLVRIRFDDKNLARYVGKFMRSQGYQDFIESAISGSAQPNANAKTLTDIQLVVPSDALLAIFGKLITTFEIAKYRNNQEIAALSMIRALLLPKLMSGKIRVPISKENLEAT